MKSARVAATATAVGTLVLLGLTAPNPAAAVDGGELELTTEKIVIFKDGYGLFIKKATATADASGRVFTETVPDGAILGSFWATAEKYPIKSMQAGWHEEVETRAKTTACITILELLRANKSKTLTLHLGKDTEVTGTLVEVLDLPPEKPKTPRLHSGVSTLPQSIGETTRELVPRGGQLVVIDVPKTGRRVLQISTVREITGDKLVTTMERKEEVTKRSKRLTMDLGKKAAGKKVELHILYFAEGVRWIPTYRVDISKSGKAHLWLQGEILNEAEDFTDTALDLVVGVPSFRFKSVISPLSLETTMRRALVQAAPGLMGSQFSNGLFRNDRMGEVRNEYAGAAVGSSALDLAPELKTSAKQDLFVYTTSQLSLKKGQRASVALWDSRVPARDLYTLDVKVLRNYDGTRYASRGPTRGSPLETVKNEVWHQLELSDTTKVPWTTGAALLLDGSLPLGQDLLTYTPPGGRVLLPITVAIDVRGTYREKELGRQANVLRWNDRSYSRVKKKGTIRITNFRKEKSTVRVRASVGGKADSASNGGKIRVNNHRASDWRSSPGSVNNHSDIEWEVTLEAGQTKEVSYTVSYYVR